MLRCLLDKGVLRSCLHHALSTESEEVMGLLLGSVDGDVVRVDGALILSRGDRRKDRVEIGYEDLSMASTIAELVADSSQSTSKIVGWYHSHPHITVLPSAVDVRTQGQYQALDGGFLGLILSVFDQGRVEVCAFQSLSSDMCWERVEVPITVVSRLPVSSESLLALQVSQLSEEMGSFLRAVDTAVLNATSATEVCAYSLHQITDRQILPVRLAMRSRRRCLTVRRDRLVQQLSKLAPDLGLYRSTGGISSDQRLGLSSSAMLTAFPHWLVQYESLKFAMTGFDVDAVYKKCADSENPIKIASHVNFKIIALPMSIGREDSSPWGMLIEDKTFALLSFDPLTDTSNGSISVRCNDIAISQEETFLFSFKEHDTEKSVSLLLTLNRTLMLDSWRNCRNTR